MKHLTPNYPSSQYQLTFQPELTDSKTLHCADSSTVLQL